MSKNIGVLCFLATISGFAAAPVANITSADSFQLRGQTVRVGGVPSWPLVVGDEFVTGESNATVQFKSGARVVLSATTKAKLEETKEGLVFRLLSGTMRILPGSTGIAFYSGNNAVKAPVDVETSVSTGSAAPNILRKTAEVATPPPSVSRRR